MALKQNLQQKQLQRLSPQQILLMKLLQIPTVAIEQRIKLEVEDNPALEEGLENIQKEKDEIDNENETEEKDIDDDEFSIDDYLNEEDIPSYRLHTSNRGRDSDDKVIPFASGKSFQEVLLAQLDMISLSEKERILSETIIGNLDGSGYLRRDLFAMVDDLAFTQNLNVTEQELQKTLSVIQDFEPAGVGARNLKECLIIQLQRKNSDEDENITQAINLLNNYFEEFAKKHYNKIIKKAGISEKQLKAAIDEVLKLNPKPGNSLHETSKSNHYVIPDFTINNIDGKLELSLNSANVPMLRINSTYIDMLSDYSKSKKKDRKQKDALIFIKRKIDSAKWFVDAIKQRHRTLLLTMDAIMNFQKEYFLTGDETTLRPLILKDIAEIVSLDISTISRVANSKYVQTPFGTFLLKSFFSESMQTQSGEEVSTREIKKIMMDCIDEENKRKPLNDEKLTNILKEKGYNIARRTVAKYREQLKIPVARLRKEL